MIRDAVSTPLEDMRATAAKEAKTEHAVIAMMNTDNKASMNAYPASFPRRNIRVDSFSAFGSIGSKRANPHR